MRIMYLGSPVRRTPDRVGLRVKRLDPVPSLDRATTVLTSVVIISLSSNVNTAHKQIETSPVETYNSAADNYQANCETRKSDAHDNGS